MEHEHAFSSLALQFSIGCGLCTATFLMSLREDSLTPAFYPLALLVYSPLIYLINCLFLRRERSMAGVVLLNSVAALVMFFAVWLFNGWCGFAYMFFAALFCIWPTVNAAALAQKPPETHTLILCLDILITLLVIFSALAGISNCNEPWMLFPSMAGCVSSFLALLTRRAGRAMGFKDWSLITAAFGGLTALLWLVMRYAATAGGGLVAAWNGLIALIKFILSTIWNFLLFLFSLIPNRDYGEYEMEMDPIAIPEIAERAEQNPGTTIVILVLLSVALVAGVVFLLFQLRKIKLGGKSKSSPRPTERRARINLLQALRRFFLPLRRRIRTRLWLWKNRNTPEGLYCTLIKQCRRTPWHKQPGETAREFLCRLKQGTEENTALYAALDRLIPAVDRALYASDGSHQLFPDAPMLRRSVKKAAARHYLHNLTSNVRHTVNRMTDPDAS